MLAQVFLAIMVCCFKSRDIVPAIAQCFLLVCTHGLTGSNLSRYRLQPVLPLKQFLHIFHEVLGIKIWDFFLA